MGAPVTGPFDWALTWFDPTVFGWANEVGHKYKRWYRQVRPYDLPLEYFSDNRQISDQLDSWNLPVSYAHAPDANPDLTEHAHNKAYNKYVDNLKADQAALSVNLAERAQAMEMMTNRLFRLAEAARMVRKLRFGDAAVALGLSRAPFEEKSWKRKPRDFGNNWLEYHFGWEPLVKDIGATIDTLQGGVPPYKVKGGGVQRLRARSQEDVGFSRVIKVIDYVAKARVGSEVEVENSDLFLANQLGFVNPATVAWELVPFSFVVDWFVNVSDFLNSFTDTLGLNITKSFHTDFQTATLRYMMLYNDPLHPEKGYEVAQSYTGTTAVMRRTLGLGGVSMKIRPVKPLSVSRGLTAIGLLLQQLKG